MTGRIKAPSVWEHPTAINGTMEWGLCYIPLVLNKNSHWVLDEGGEDDSEATTSIDLPGEVVKSRSILAVAHIEDNLQFESITLTAENGEKVEFIAAGEKTSLSATLEMIKRDPPKGWQPRQSALVVLNNHGTNTWSNNPGVILVRGSLGKERASNVLSGFLRNSLRYMTVHRDAFDTIVKSRRTYSPNVKSMLMEGMKSTEENTTA